MTIGEYIGRRARERRRAAGLSQREVGRRSSIFRTNVSRFEAGRNPPNFDTVARVARALGCTVADLVAGWEQAHDAG